ncbi:hypothetical protein CDAR_423731, partial [Caerostris darwini]
VPGSLTFLHRDPSGIPNDISQHGRNSIHPDIGMQGRAAAGTRPPPLPPPLVCRRNEEKGSYSSSPPPPCLIERRCRLYLSLLHSCQRSKELF